MTGMLMLMTALALPAADDVSPRLAGAFIQFDSTNSAWPPATWRHELAKMRDAGLHIIILQALEVRKDVVPSTSGSVIPHQAGDPDPVGVILDFADAHPGMKVFIGLRNDTRLLGSELLNDPNSLRAELADELPRNTRLAALVADRYHLKGRRSFAGWYLPWEFANFTETFAESRDGWVFQMNQFTRALALACDHLVEKPVAVSPYFNGFVEPGSGLVGPQEMGKKFARFLEDTDISIVMLQDGVGAHNIPAHLIRSWVAPYLLSVRAACKNASRAGEDIEFWLNVESFTQLDKNTRVPAHIGRLGQQIDLGATLAEKVVTFEFTHYLGMSPLYENYVEFISAPRGR